MHLEHYLELKTIYAISLLGYRLVSVLELFLDLLQLISKLSVVMLEGSVSFLMREHRRLYISLFNSVLKLCHMLL